MKARLILMLYAFVLSSFHLQAQSNEKTTITSILMEQQEAWNDNDIEAFMKHYWNNKNLTFVSKSGVMRGWEATRARYYKNYPNKDAMGTLTFKIKELNITSTQSALLIGSWHLKRPKDGDIGGFFSLTWQKINGEWKIISDHTS